MRRTPARRPGVALTLRRRPRLRTGLVVGDRRALRRSRWRRTVQQAEDARAAWGARIPRAGRHARTSRPGDRLDAGNTRVVAPPRAARAGRRPHARSPPTAGSPHPSTTGEVRARGAAGARRRLGARGSPPAGQPRAMAIPVEPGTTPTARRRRPRRRARGAASGGGRGWAARLRAGHRRAGGRRHRGGRHDRGAARRRAAAGGRLRAGRRHPGALVGRRGDRLSGTA